LNLLVGTLLITVMLILSTGVRDKVAVSSLVPALLPSTPNSAPVLPELVLIPEEVVVLAPLTADLTTASGSTLTTTMIVTILMLITTLDFPVSKPSEDLLVPSVSLVPSTPRRLVLLPLSASSTLAVDLAAALSLPSMLVASLLFAPRRVMSVSADMVVSLTAPIPLNTAAPSVRRSAPVVAWVEVPARVVSAPVTRVTRVSSTVLTLLSTAPLLVRRSALVDVWVEVLARVVSVCATRATRVRTVLSMLN